MNAQGNYFQEIKYSTTYLKIQQVIAKYFVDSLNKCIDRF